MRKVGASKEPPLRKVEASGEPIRRKTKVREPVQRRKEWERSRRCGWEIDVGADVAAVMMVPGADTSDG